jgi:hypothetical protein
MGYPKPIKNGRKECGWRVLFGRWRWRGGTARYDVAIYSQDLRVLLGLKELLVGSRSDWKVPSRFV